MRLASLSLLLIACLATSPSARAGEIQIRANGDRIDVAATSAPVADILARIAQQTGMKIVYDGPQPRQILSVSLIARTPAEAVLGVLEGLGLNYALRMDRTGTSIDTLLMYGATTTAARPAATPVPPQTQPAPFTRPPFQPPGQPGQPPPQRDEPEQEDQEPEPQNPALGQPTPTPPPGPQNFSGPIPGPGQPGSPFNPALGPLTLPTPQPTPTPGPSPELHRPEIPRPRPTPTPQID
jgi:hypothetical protein